MDKITLLKNEKEGNEKEDYESEYERMLAESEMWMNKKEKSKWNLQTKI